jgi:phage recombination protein Bet
MSGRGALAATRVREHDECLKGRSEMNASDARQVAAARGNGAGAAGEEAVRAPAPVGRRPSTEEVRLIRTTLMSPRDREPTDEEVALFLRQIERSGLDPFARQIYVVYRYSRRRRREEMSIETTIDGLRLMAERTGRYEGQTRARWCGEDGKWRESWPAPEPPVAATVGVYKRGAREPTWGTAHFCEYAEFWEDSGRPKGFYETMPRNQLAIRAEAQALRKAFPAELSGLYAAEELVREDDEGASAGDAAEAGGGSPTADGEGDGATPSGGGMRAVDPRVASGAPAQLRRALRDGIAAARLGDELASKLAGFYFDEPRVERLGEERVRELIELVEAIGASGVAAGTLKGQLTKAEGEADRERARAVITRWILHRASEASANGGEPRAAGEAAAQGSPHRGDGEGAP